MYLKHTYFAIFIIKSNTQFELQVHRVSFFSTEELIVSKAYAIYRKLDKITQQLKIPKKQDSK